MPVAIVYESILGKIDFPILLSSVFITGLSKAGDPKILSSAFLLHSEKENILLVSPGSLVVVFLGLQIMCTNANPLKAEPMGGCDFSLPSQLAARLNFPNLFGLNGYISDS